MLVSCAQHATCSSPAAAAAGSNLLQVHTPAFQHATASCCVTSAGTLYLVLPTQKHTNHCLPHNAVPAELCKLTHVSQAAAVTGQE